MNQFRPPGTKSNSRRFTFAFWLLKLYLGQSFRVENDGLLKSFWRLFELDCGFDECVIPHSFITTLID